MLTEKEMISEFEKYCKKFNTYIVDDMKSYDDLYETLNSKVNYEEFCSGSNISFGYHHPSPVVDLIIGNMSRGKLHKKRSKLSKPTHRYGFDKSGRLLIVDKIMPKDFVEFTDYSVFEYNKNTVTIISISKFESDIEIESVAFCEYDDDGRINSFTEGYPDGDIFSTVYQERYTYSDKGIDAVVTFSCDGDKRNVDATKRMINDMKEHDAFKANAKKVLGRIERTGCLLNVETYRFFHDENGHITSFEVYNDSGESTTYKVPIRKRRKV